MAVLTLEEIRDAIHADLLANVSVNLDLSETSALGSIVDVFARQLRIAYEGLEILQGTFSPDARGEELERLASLTKTYRKPATASRVTINLTATGPIAIGGVRLRKADDPMVVFTNAEAISIGSADVVFECATLGPVSAPAGSLYRQVSPHPSISSITPNALDASLGVAEESDGSLALRRRQSLSAGKTSRAEAIRKAVTDLDGVRSVTVRENDSMEYIGLVPPKSIHVIVYGPDVPTPTDNADVAATIALIKPAGIRAYGATYSEVIDGATIAFSRPSTTTVPISATVITDRSLYAGDSSLKSYLFERASSFYTPGVDVRASQWISWIQSFPGVIGVDAIAVNAIAYGTVIVDDAAVATTPIASITITSSYGTP